jgi:hypothetical protein
VLAFFVAWIIVVTQNPSSVVRGPLYVYGP